MKSVILAGGFGERLNGDSGAKALIDINGKTILERAVESISFPRISKIYILTNNLFFQDFINWADSYEGNKDKIQIVNNLVDKKENRKGSVGDLGYIISERKLEGHSLLVLGSDNLFNFDISKMLYTYDEIARNNTVVGLYNLGDKEEAKRMGVPVLDGWRIKEVEEKPKDPKYSWVNTFLYVFSSHDVSEVQKYLETAKEEERDHMGRYINYLARNFEVYGHPFFEGKWFDIGTKESLERARREF